MYAAIGGNCLEDKLGHIFVYFVHVTKFDEVYPYMDWEEVGTTKVLKGQMSSIFEAKY